MEWIPACAGMTGFGLFHFVNECSDFLTEYVIDSERHKFLLRNPHFELRDWVEGVGIVLSHVEFIRCIAITHIIGCKDRLQKVASLSLSSHFSILTRHFIKYSMVVHYFTLSALSKELDTALRGANLSEIFSQQKNELVLTVSREGEAKSLVVSVEPRMNYCFLRESVARARKNSIDLFPDAVGKTVEELSLLPSDRIIQVKLAEGLMLWLQLYNSARSNVLLLDRNLTIQDAFKNRKELVGTSIPPKEADSIGHQTGARIEELRASGSGVIVTSLKKAIPILGAIYNKEVLLRAGINDQDETASLTPGQWDAIIAAIEELFGQANLPEPSVYEAGKEAILSVIPLTHLLKAEVQKFQSTNDAVREFVIRGFREKGTASEKNTLADKLSAEFEKVSRSVRAMEAEAAEANRAIEYEQIGKTLLASLGEVKKGMKQVSLQNVVDAGSMLLIALDPAKSPAQNADHYFDKARRARAAREENAQRLLETRKRKHVLEELLAKLERAESSDEVREFVEENKSLLQELKLIQEKPGEPPPPFRIFTVNGGYEVWVGKSSANNDLLTTRYAKPNDFWFHVRGASGSHTVLKVRSGTPTPKEAIRAAAGIAAYYSKMRNAGNVPVAYCERKYVRKPRGAREGAVVLEREEIVFVKPALP